MDVKVESLHETYRQVAVERDHYLRLWAGREIRVIICYPRAFLDQVALFIRTLEQRDKYHHLWRTHEPI